MRLQLTFRLFIYTFLVLAVGCGSPDRSLLGEQTPFDQPKGPSNGGSGGVGPGEPREPAPDEPQDEEVADLNCAPVEAFSRFATLNLSSPNSPADFKVGEQIAFRFESSMDGHYALLSMDSRGDIGILAPGTGQAAHQISAGRFIQLPEKGSRYVFNIAPPRGLETVRLIYFSSIKGSKDSALFSDKDFDLTQYRGEEGLDALTNAIVEKARQTFMGISIQPFCDIVDKQIRIH